MKFHNSWQSLNLSKITGNLQYLVLLSFLFKYFVN